MFLSKSYFLSFLFFTTVTLGHHGEVHSEGSSGSFGLLLIMLSVLFSTLSVWLEGISLGTKKEQRADEKVEDTILASLPSQKEFNALGDKYVS
tara:strand:- start:526 stop:804 length:279 start_codon:yes stop_codon:yes gene_type:complete